MNALLRHAIFRGDILQHFCANLYIASADFKVMNGDSFHFHVLHAFVLSKSVCDRNVTFLWKEGE
jgi:hypothetical protein